MYYRIKIRHYIKGVISVGLFGQPCDIDNILKLANANKLWVLDDAAQSFDQL